MNSLDKNKIKEILELDEETGEELLREIIDIFFTSTPIKLQSMADLLMQNDCASVRKEAHALRSGAMVLGANALAECAKQIEYAPEEQSPEVMRKFLSKAKEEFDKVRDLLDAYVTSGNGDSSKFPSGQE